MKQPSTMVAAALAALLLADPATAQRSNMCQLNSDGKFTLTFDIKPSLVVHSAGVMDATRQQVSLTDNPNEGAFSFRRTIAAILDSSLGSGASASADQEAFLQTMLASFQSSGRQLNSVAGVSMPFASRSEANLNAQDLLNEASPTGMKPLALFNRFDLAPDNWSYCGEHRIVYGRKRPNPNNPFERFLLIFEAMVPNPDASNSPAGCRRVAEFWGGLTGLNEQEQATRLSAFFYEGKTGHPDGDLKGPVVDFRNYGGDASSGQVRANAFMQQPWQLREWLTQSTFSATGPELAFVPVTVKNNPLAELYHDGFPTDPAITPGNIPAALQTLHGQFVQALTSTIAANLLSEGTPKHQELATGLTNYDLGSAPPIDEETILLFTIALGNDDKFNEFQSVSQGNSDVPGEPPGSSPLVTGLLDQVGAIPSISVNPQTGQTILNRARAATCAGCHMTAARSTSGFFNLPGVIVRENANSTVVRWPDVDPATPAGPGGFVHVNENTRALSPALEDAFLPVRRYVLGRFLCETLDKLPTPPAPSPAADALVSQLQGQDLPAAAVASGDRYLDEVVAAFEEATQVKAAKAEKPATLDAAIAAMEPAERSALRVKVAEVIATARRIEQARPGAFVETRRPH